MDKRELRIDYIVWENRFPEGYEQLCQEAIHAAEKAYSVYSNFSVGAAVCLEDGKIVTGNECVNIYLGKFFGKGNFCQSPNAICLTTRNIPVEEFPNLIKCKCVSKFLS